MTRIEKPSGKYLIFEKLGPNLEELFQKCGRKFSLKTTIQIAVRMLELIEYVHSCSYVYLDIKPDNFLIGMKKHDKKLYLVDFGLAHKFLTKNGEHIPWNENYYDMRGTPEYVSTWIHYGVEASRRDDIIAIGYCLIRFLKGTLPWENHQIPEWCPLDFAASKHNMDLLAMKLKERFWEKTFITSLPEEFSVYLEYGYGLSYETRPDYEFLRNLFISLFKKNKFEEDNHFDWEA